MVIYRCFLTLLFLVATPHSACFIRSDVSECTTLMLIRFSRVVNQHWPLEAYVLLDINQVPFLDSTFEHDVLHDFFFRKFYTV
jgi:hypothetical protein